MKYFLAPHHDDETLFGAYTLIRENPLVIIVLESHVQDSRGTGITHQMRHRETAEAMKVLGCDWEQWPFNDLTPAWYDIEQRIKHLPKVEVIYAPAIEPLGHPQHTKIGEIAESTHPGKVIHYMTYQYTTVGRTRNDNPVPCNNGMVLKKQEALLCYRSQMEEPSTAHHFLEDQSEYYLDV